MLRVEGLHKRYGADGPEAVAGVDFAVRAAEVFGLLGPNAWCQMDELPGPRGPRPARLAGSVDGGSAGGDLPAVVRPSGPGGSSHVKTGARPQTRDESRPLLRREGKRISSRR